MSGKRFKAVIAAVLLAFVLSISIPSLAAPSLTAPPIVLSAECDSTAGGCN